MVLRKEPLEFHTETDRVGLTRFQRITTINVLVAIIETGLGHELTAGSAAIEPHVLQLIKPPALFSPKVFLFQTLWFQTIGVYSDPRR